MFWIFLDGFLNDSGCGAVYFFYQMLDIVLQGHMVMRCSNEKVRVVFISWGDTEGILFLSILRLPLFEEANANNRFKQ